MKLILKYAISISVALVITVFVFLFMHNMFDMNNYDYLLKNKTSTIEYVQDLAEQEPYFQIENSPKSLFGCDPFTYFTDTASECYCQKLKMFATVKNIFQLNSKNRKYSKWSSGYCYSSYNTNAATFYKTLFSVNTAAFKNIFANQIHNHMTKEINSLKKEYYKVPRVGVFRLTLIDPPFNIDFSSFIWQSINEQQREMYKRQNNNLQNNNLMPLIKIAPNYPRKALIAKIEGWVKVEFTVDKQGAIINPSVVNAKPAGIFEDEALKAISKYRYKPKYINFQAVEQTGTETIEFKLAKD